MDHWVFIGDRERHFDRETLRRGYFCNERQQPWFLHKLQRDSDHRLWCERHVSATFGEGLTSDPTVYAGVVYSQPDTRGQSL